MNLQTRYPTPWPTHTPTALCSPLALLQPEAHGLRVTLTTGVEMPTHDPVKLAMAHAGLITPEELERHLRPLRHSAEQARLGLLTEGQWLVLCTALNDGRAIESQGVVRGFEADLQTIQDALTAMGDRATQHETRPWKPCACHATELAAVRDLVRIYSFQSPNLSFGEYQAAHRLALARVRSMGGEVSNAPRAEMAGIQ
jgi:hypothetical protein